MRVSGLFLFHRKVLPMEQKSPAGMMRTMCQGRLLLQPHIGAQSCQAPQRVRGWGVEVGLPTLFQLDQISKVSRPSNCIL